MTSNARSRHTLVLLATAALAACGPAPGDTAGDGETDSDAGESATDPTTGDDPSDTDTDTTGEQPPALACAGASWVTAIEPGELFGVAADSRGHAIGLGTSQTNLTFPDALVVDLDAEGTQQYKVGSGTVDQYDLVDGGGIDGDDNVYALVSEGFAAGDSFDIRYWLRKFDTGGALISELDLGTATQNNRPYDLAVAPDGSVVITSHDAVDHDVVTRRAADFSVLWEVKSESLRVRAVNAAGVSVATRGRDGVVMIDAAGELAWNIDWPLWNPGTAALDDHGNVVVAGKTDAENGQLTVARFDPDGSLAWETKFQIRNAFDEISDIAINAAGTVAVAGNIDGKAFLAAFAVRLDASGKILDQHLCDEQLDSRGYAIALDEAGRMALAGAVRDAANYWSYIASFE